MLSPSATRALIDRFLSAPSPIGERPQGPLATLTDREREITALAAHGLSNQEIAERLVVSPLTVRTHIHRAMMADVTAKLGDVAFANMPEGWAQKPPGDAGRR